MPKAQKKKYLLSLLSTVTALVVLTTGVFAWFVLNKDKKAPTKSMAIQTPPVIYVLDSDAEDMAQLSLTGLQIGVPMKVIFCVSNTYPITNPAGKVKRFSLELVYTQNMQATFTLYAAQAFAAPTENTMEYYSQTGKVAYCQVNEKPLTATDVSAKGNLESYGEGVSSNNNAVYKQYLATSPDNESLSFTTDTTGNAGQDALDTGKCKYFVLDITWDHNFSGVDAKETDLVYIIAKEYTS